MPRPCRSTTARLDSCSDVEPRLSRYASAAPRGNAKVTRGPRVTGTRRVILAPNHLDHRLRVGRAHVSRFSLSRRCAAIRTAEFAAPHELYEPTRWTTSKNTRKPCTDAVMTLFRLREAR